MKKLFAILLALFSTQLFAASVTVNPFKIDFFLEEGAYEVDFELTMACRYEKFVISDSAEFEYIFEEVPLEVVVQKMDNGLEKVTLINKEKRKLKLTGWHRSNKECQTMQKYFLKSKIYALGWANQFHRPLRYGLFKHSRLAEEKFYDIEGLRDLIEGKELGFVYKAVSNQVNIKFAFDGVRSTGMSTYLGGSAYRKPGTDMPWPIQK